MGGPPWPGHYPGARGGPPCHTAAPPPGAAWTGRPRVGFTGPGPRYQMGGSPTQQGIYRRSGGLTRSRVRPPGKAMDHRTRSGDRVGNWLCQPTWSAAPLRGITTAEEFLPNCGYLYPQRISATAWCLSPAPAFGCPEAGGLCLNRLPSNDRSSFSDDDEEFRGRAVSCSRPPQPTRARPLSPAAWAAAASLPSSFSYEAPSLPHLRL